MRNKIPMIFAIFFIKYFRYYVNGRTWFLPEWIANWFWFAFIKCSGLHLQVEIFSNNALNTPPNRSGQNHENTYKTYQIATMGKYKRIKILFEILERYQKTLRSICHCQGTFCSFVFSIHQKSLSTSLIGAVYQSKTLWIWLSNLLLFVMPLHLKNLTFQSNP